LLANSTDSNPRPSQEVRLARSARNRWSVSDSPKGKAAQRAQQSSSRHHFLMVCTLVDESILLANSTDSNPRPSQEVRLARSARNRWSVSDSPKGKAAQRAQQSSSRHHFLTVCTLVDESILLANSTDSTPRPSQSVLTEPKRSYWSESFWKSGVFWIA